MDGEHAYATSGGTAWRRRQRRLRARRLFILWSTKMEVAAALHHTARQRLTGEATQTTSACDRSNAATHTETYAASAPVFDYVAPAPVNLNIASPLAATCAATHPSCTCDRVRGARMRSRRAFSMEASCCKTRTRGARTCCHLRSTSSSDRICDAPHM